jgi:hypothetical protein
MATVRLQLTPGYERALLRSPQLLAAMKRATNHIANEAKRSAPRRGALTDDRQRHYADMIDGQAWIGPAGVVGTVNARHFTSLFIEFGTVHTPARAPLRKALDASQGRAL